MTKTTTPADTEAWADAQVRRHASWPLDILGTGPHCTGMCHQGRRPCVHPVECGVQRPVAEASSDLLADPPPKREPLLSPAGRFWLLYVAFIASLAVSGVLTLINHAPKP